MKLAQIPVALALIALLSGAASPAPAGLDLEDLAEMKLAHGGYTFSLNNAYWASARGAEIVPVLAKMLKHENGFKDESAFPFNAIWALGRIATPAAVKVLKSYQAGKHRHDASLAIRAAELRIHLHDRDVGVTIRDDSALFQAADHASKTLKTVNRGTPVKVLAFGLPGPKGQTGPFGNPSHFDKVKLLPKGPTGYLERAADDFSTVY